MWLAGDPFNRNPVSEANKGALTSQGQSTEGASRNVVELHMVGCWHRLGLFVVFKISQEGQMVSNIPPFVYTSPPPSPQLGLGKGGKFQN